MKAFRTLRGATDTGEEEDVLRSEYRYNGLNWRVVKLADTTVAPDGVLNQQRVMYYSANWQLLEEIIDDDVDAQDTHVVRCTKGLVTII